MRNVRVNTKIDVRPFLKYLRKVERRSTSFMGVFRAAMRDLAREHAENFATNGATSGSAWKALDGEYANWKLSEYGAGGVLVRTGALKHSLTRISNGRGAIRDIGKLRAEFGTEVNYAHLHQTGTAEMAARKVVFTPNRFAEGLGRDALDYLAHGSSAIGSTRGATNIGRR